MRAAISAADASWRVRERAAGRDWYADVASGM
jgi:hypothetical protein